MKKFGRFIHIISISERHFLIIAHYCSLVIHAIIIGLFEDKNQITDLR